MPALTVKALVALVALLDAAPSTTAQFDDLWKKRDDPAALAQLKTMGTQFAQSDDYEKLWRDARLQFWLADGAKNDDQKKTLAKAGWDVGKKAVAKNPKGLAGLYWTSVNIGTYSEAVGVVNALFQGLESKFRDPLLEVEKADPNHQNADIDYVGPETTLGRYWYSLPWPKRSLSKSKAQLEEAIKARPVFLRAHFFLAQTLESDGDKAGAKAQIDYIKNAPGDYDPPEARRIKARAEAWAAKALH